jgi:hypothetical protein
VRAPYGIALVTGRHRREFLSMWKRVVSVPQARPCYGLAPRKAGLVRERIRCVGCRVSGGGEGWSASEPYRKRPCTGACTEHKPLG